MMFYLVMSTLALLSSGHAMAYGGRHLSIGECPNITEKYDFEPIQYTGRWFELQRYPVYYERNEDCVNAVYTDLGNGYIEVYNWARVISGGYSNITGKAHLIAPGVLLVEFEGYPAGEYHVLDTDYEQFSCVYNFVQQGEVRVQDAWILSRTMVMQENTFSHAMQVFVDNGIDISIFDATYQGDDCPYPS
ncbi:hypothetical protein SK128_002429 [Halocaridina rubra]|uniref:Lipocalin/cytosolic fatty-acid binding domain-containing protein n=1 Tax=Halocaridina rubra TaxID=373956 RepID=A0AAN9A5Y8_HALRR